MLEYEKKLTLNAKEYLYLRQTRAKYALPAVQTNYYYDTHGFTLNRRGTTCRIRETNGAYTATVKEHGYHAPDCFSETRECSLETSAPALNEYDTGLFADKNVVLQGSMTTERIVFADNNGLKAVLDKNKYLGLTDYELEIEYTPASTVLAEQLFDDIRTDLKLRFVNPDDKTGCRQRTAAGCESKSERFFKRLTEINTTKEGMTLCYPFCMKLQN